MAYLGNSSYLVRTRLGPNTKAHHAARRRTLIDLQRLPTWSLTASRPCASLDPSARHLTRLLQDLATLLARDARVARELELQILDPYGPTGPGRP